MTILHDSVSLGKSGITIPAIGIGGWSWGDRFFGVTAMDTRKKIFRRQLRPASIMGQTFLTRLRYTARDSRKKILGKILRDSSNQAIVATKFFPFPWRFTKSDLIRALRKSLHRLQRSQVDLYQVHWPFPPRSVETWTEALGDVIELNLAKAVGVSNYNEIQMRKAQAVLKQPGHSLASNQVEFSLINKKVERSGLLKACRELNVSLIAYSPLGMGVLTGKYTPDKPMPGFRGRKFKPAYLQSVQPLRHLLREIGRDHDGKLSSQVALNWTICKGALPIPGAKNIRQVQENIGALGWRLSQAEIAALDQASDLIV